MRFLEVRRHSFTKKGDARGRGSHLSREGVAAARAVSTELGAVAYVAVSEAPRTLETALAMGLAVDAILPLGAVGYSTPEVAHHDQWAWATPYVRYRTLLERHGPLAQAAESELELWRSALLQVADGEVALIVTHGGSVEPTLVAALPEADVASWGPPFSHLDGVQLALDADRWNLVAFHRYNPATPPDF